AALGPTSSGARSPPRGHPSAMAFGRPDLTAAGTELIADVRGKDLPVRVVALPFYSRSCALTPYLEGPDMTDELRYSKDHEWVRLDDSGHAVIGVTDFAAGQLGDVVYVDRPEGGGEGKAGTGMGDVAWTQPVRQRWARGEA